jgi:hypothetical protein
MHTNNEIEDLSNCKGEGCCCQNEEGSSFTEDFNDDEGFETKVEEETDKWEEKIQNVESDVFESCRIRCLKFGGPSKGGVSGDIPCSNEENDSGSKNKLKSIKVQKGHTNIEVGVPSSSHWKPIRALRKRTHMIAVMRPIWIAENH